MNKTVGIVGGGQLGRMLTIAAKKLGFYVVVLDPTEKSPAGQLADEQIVADFKDEFAILKLSEKVDFLTFEIELANAAILQEIAGKGIAVNPSARTLNIIKDKLTQKQFLQSKKILTAEFRMVNDIEDVNKSIKAFKLPVVLKSRFDGYDGRGNAVIKKYSDIPSALRKLSGQKLYVEEFVHFKKELAVMVAKNTKGEIETYPVVETVHQNNICHLVIAPAQIDDYTAKKARKLAIEVAKNLEGAGVFGVEMFLTLTNQVMINEIAPRVHNSGHYTIEGCVTSQFEQHIRAVSGLPLGKTEMVVPSAVMINILGERQGDVEIKGLDKALSIPNVSVHIYGKKETKIERKMGHITVVGKSADECLKKAKHARKLISI